MAYTPEQKAARRAIKGVGPDTDLAGNPLTEEQKATMREVEARWAKEDAAKAHPLAALIAGVTRYNRIGQQMEQSPDGRWLHRLEVLAALEAVQPPDLVDAGKVLEGVTPGPWNAHHTEDYSMVVVHEPQFTQIGHLYEAFDARFIAWCREGVPALIALATAQAAQIAGLTAKARESAMQELASLGQAQEAYEAQLAAEAEAATLRAEVERLRGALDQIAWSNDSKWQADCARAALEGKA